MRVASIPIRMATARDALTDTLRSRPRSIQATCSTQANRAADRHVSPAQKSQKGCDKPCKFPASTPPRASASCWASARRRNLVRTRQRCCHDRQRCHCLSVANAKDRAHPLGRFGSCPIGIHPRPRIKMRPCSGTLVAGPTRGTPGINRGTREPASPSILEGWGHA